MNDISRVPGSSPGRSRAVGFGDLVWVVANSADVSEDIHRQIDTTLTRLEEALRLAGSSKERMLSAQIFLRDIADKVELDGKWTRWIGDNPAHWPQRVCVGVGLAPGLLIEIQAVAAKEAR